MSGNERRAFFRCAVHIDRDLLTVPVNLFRRIRIVVNVDGYFAASFEAKQRPRKLAVVGDSGDDSLRCDLDGRSPPLGPAPETQSLETHWRHCAHSQLQYQQLRRRQS